jgi:hypothetical protein
MDDDNDMFAHAQLADGQPIRKEFFSFQDAKAAVERVRFNRRNIASLTMSAASSTFWAYESVHSEERHFALVEAVAFAMPTQARCS